MRRTSLALAAILLLGALTSARGQYLEATIPVGDSPYGLIWSPLGNKVYVANTQDGTVSVIDGATNVVIATIPVEDYPSMFALNTVDDKVYCPSGEEDRLNVICTYGDTFIGKVRLTGYPSFPAYSERRNKLYVSGMDNDRVYVLDGHADTVVEVIGVRHPEWLTLQPVTDRLLVSSTGDSDTLVVFDCDSDTVTSRQPLARSISHAAAPRVGLLGRVYVFCDSVVEVYSPDGEEHLASITTPVYAPWASAYCPATAKLYVGNLNRAGIAVVDCSSDSVIGVVAAGERVYDLLCDTILGRFYALALGKVLVFDSWNDSLRATVQLPAYSESATWNPVNRRLHASAPVANVVYVIRDTTSAVSEQAEVAVVRRAVSRIVRGVLDLPASDVGHQASSVLLDVTGRKVLDLRVGDNEVGQLPTGVYYIRTEGASPVRRVVVVR